MAGCLSPVIIGSLTSGKGGCRVETERGTGDPAEWTRSLNAALIRLVQSPRAPVRWALAPPSQDTPGRESQLKGSRLLLPWGRDEEGHFPFFSFLPTGCAKQIKHCALRDMPCLALPCSLDTLGGWVSLPNAGNDAESGYGTIS